MQGLWSIKTKEMVEDFRYCRLQMWNINFFWFKNKRPTWFRLLFCFTSYVLNMFRTTQTQPHQISNTQRTENKTTDVVIQQHSRELLMMDIIMSETFWAHKKWNKIASDIKLVFYSSTITMMHGPINIRFFWFVQGVPCSFLSGFELPQIFANLPI